MSDWHVQEFCCQNMSNPAFFVHRSAKPLHHMCAVHACHHQDIPLSGWNPFLFPKKKLWLMNVATTLLKHAWHTRVVLNQAQFHGPFAPLQRHPKKSAANVEPWHASWNPVMRQSSGRPTENHERKLEEPILGVTFHTG